MHMNKFFLLAIAASLTAISSLASLYAADTIFSKDGTKVFGYEDGSEPTLAVFDLSKKTITDISLRKWLGIFPDKDPNYSKGGEIYPSLNGLSLSKTGKILCTTDHALWAFDPIKNSCVKVCDAPENLIFTDVAANPKTGDILLLTEIRKGHEKEAGAAGAKVIGPTSIKQAIECPSLILRHDTKKLVPLLNRRAQDWSSPVFTNDGNLYFVNNYDVWTGKIEPQSFFPEFGFDLAAHRLAPVALLETDGGTSNSIGAASLAVSKKKLYVSLSRLGGSGDGAIFRLNLIPYQDHGLSYSQRLAISRSALNSTEVIYKDENRYLCASPDGALVFFESGGKYWLVRNDGKPEKIAFKDIRKK